MDWKKIFVPQEFLENMVERGVIEELLETYPQNVTTLCHNACAWMFKKAHDLKELPLNNLYFVTGTIGLGGIYSNLRLDHSWIEYRPEDSSPTVIDLTLCQFRVTAEELYIGKKENLDLNEWEAISFSNTDKVIELIENL